MSLWSDSLAWLARSFAGAPAGAWLLFLGIVVALLASGILLSWWKKTVGRHEPRRATQS